MYEKNVNLEIQHCDAYFLFLFYFKESRVAFEDSFFYF